MFLLLDSQLSSKKKQTKKKKNFLVFFPTPNHRNRNGVSTEKMLVGWMKNEWMNRKNTIQKKLNSDLVLHLFEGFFPLKHTQKNKINLNL